MARVLLRGTSVAATEPVALPMLPSAELESATARNRQVALPVVKRRASTRTARKTVLPSARIAAAITSSARLVRCVSTAVLPARHDASLQTSHGACQTGEGTEAIQGGI